MRREASAWGLVLRVDGHESAPAVVQSLPDLVALLEIVGCLVAAVPAGERVTIEIVGFETAPPPGPRTTIASLLLDEDSLVVLSKLADAAPRSVALDDLTSRARPRDAESAHRRPPTRANLGALGLAERQDGAVWRANRPRRPGLADAHGRRGDGRCLRSRTSPTRPRRCAMPPESQSSDRARSRRRLAAVRRWIFRRRHGALVDALRRSNELLGGGSTDYFSEEVEYVRAVNFRLLREYDPTSATDGKVR